MQTSQIFTMISILFTVLLCLFSVHVTDCTEIQDETIHTYNYGNNFGDLFVQGYENSFNAYKYENINPILAEKYEGPHIGGVFMMKGNDTMTTTNYFNGYIVDVSTTQYCGSHTNNYMTINVYYRDGETDQEHICGYHEPYEWAYNMTWIPETRFSHSGDQFRVEIRSWNLAVDSPNGLDEIKIRTTNKIPPQISTTSIPATAPPMTP